MSFSSYSVTSPLLKGFISSSIKATCFLAASVLFPLLRFQCSVVPFDYLASPEQYSKLHLYTVSVLLTLTDTLSSAFNMSRTLPVAFRCLTATGSRG